MDTEEILRLMNVAIEKDNFSEFGDLLKKHGSKLPVEQRREVLCNALVAAIEKKWKCVFEDLWKSHGSKFPAERRREVVYRAIHAAIKNGGFYFSDFNHIEFLLQDHGSELSAEQRREVVYLAIHLAIERRHFEWIEFLWWYFGSELSAEQRRETVRIAVYAAVDAAIFVECEESKKCKVLGDGTIIRIKLKDFASQLSDKELIAATRRALYATIEKNRFGLFLEFLRNHPYRSELLPPEEVITIIHCAIYASIKQGAFFYSRTLLESYGSELISREMANVLNEMMDKIDKSLATNLATCPQYVVNTKSTLLSWANDQCQKIARAYGIKITQQAIQAQGEALIEAESIAAAMNQVILAYQDVPPAEQNVVQEEEVQPKKRVQKALADLYCTVEHAYRTFLSKKQHLFASVSTS
jgi:hypothetical protein